MTTVDTKHLSPQEDELSALDAWANEVRDGILEQVHVALDAYERASQQHTASLFSREAATRSEDIDRAMSRCRSDLLSALETLSEQHSARGHSARGRIDDTQDRQERNEARLAALEALPRPLEQRIASLEAATSAGGGTGAHWRDWSPVAMLPSSPSTPKPAGVASASSLDELNSRLARNLAALEADILNLQGEHAMLETRTQVQSVSNAVFALSAWDMDEIGRAKSMEALADKETEVRRLLEAAQEAKDRGGSAEVLARLGIRFTTASAGDQGLGDALDEATHTELQV